MVLVGTLVVGLGEFAVATSPGEMIRTFGLGSCIAVMAFHSTSGAVGMLHVVLPESGTQERAQTQPGYFADTGVVALFDALDKTTGGGRYVIKLVGGAAVLRHAGGYFKDSLNIGKRNLLATKKALWKKGLGVLAEETGGDQSRSVTIHVGSLDVEIRHGNLLVKVL